MAQGVLDGTAERPPAEPKCGIRGFRGREKSTGLFDHQPLGGRGRSPRSLDCPYRRNVAAEQRVREDLAHTSDSVPMSMCGAPLVLLAAETDEALPPGLAFDADGNPIQDGRVFDR
jgi:hypothetical protein